MIPPSMTLAKIIQKFVPCRQDPEALAPITIGITTFAARFYTYFAPLLARIRELDQQSEVVVAINGEHQQEFDENYRAEILKFIAGQPRVYPVFFPSFRGLAKLWNTVVIHASQDYILMLNDDLSITAADCLEKIKLHIPATATGRSPSISLGRIFC